MVANDDLEGKTTHFTGFYTHTISGSNIPKPPIVRGQKPDFYELNISLGGIENILLKSVTHPLHAHRKKTILVVCKALTGIWYSTYQ